MYENDRGRVVKIYLLVIVFASIVSTMTIANSNLDFNSHYMVKKFHARNYSEWFSTFNLSDSNLEYLNTDQWIEEPAYTWQVLLRINYYLSGDFHQGSSCMFYKIPLRKLKNRLKDNDLVGGSIDSDDLAMIHSGLGILKIVQAKEDQKCSDLKFTNSDNVIPDIVDLKFFLSGNNLSFVFDLFDLKIRTVRRHQLSFPFRNLSATPSIRSTKIYSPSVEKRAVTGLLFLPVMKNSKNIKGFANEFQPKIIGNIHDNYLDRTAIKCHQVNSKCETVGKNECNRCRFGWFETIDSACPNQGSKYCGISRCGERGQPACWRGKHLFGELKQNQCIDHKVAGFCQRGLNTECDGNGTLICL